MIAHIDGKVAEKRQGELVLDAQGIGFLLNCSANTLAAAPAVGERMRCYTQLNVREDAMELFGFATREERSMFVRLCGVSGIGPRSALAILSSLSLHNLSVALVTGDVAALSRAPGIGKKTAQRLILELKDKVEQADVSGAGIAPLPEGAADAAQEAVAALVALGYSNLEEQRAIARVRDQAQTTDALILLALKNMNA
ncbi:MAG TPA: Holliday junction branch migration protein RuvA [Clostridia bacterium]|nr:Holliday junction branch migration protein RuvA [Clostridia bacterium]